MVSRVGNPGCADPAADDVVDVEETEAERELKKPPSFFDRGCAAVTGGGADVELPSCGLPQAGADCGGAADTGGFGDSILPLLLPHSLNPHPPAAFLDSVLVTEAESSSSPSSLPFVIVGGGGSFIANGIPDPKPLPVDDAESPAQLSAMNCRRALTQFSLASRASVVSAKLCFAACNSFWRFWTSILRVASSAEAESLGGEEGPSGRPGDGWRPMNEGRVAVGGGDVPDTPSGNVRVWPFGVSDIEKSMAPDTEDMRL